MPTQEIALTDKEKEIVQEVQKSLGHETIEETIGTLPDKGSKNYLEN
ncbi:hypothetical protein MWMV18_MWMV18_03234 [Acinetobacter calcoaceticus]|nr:hypothetical protein MWMV18_MWMV18_03234 [Acinetobacter calcoaceticus]